MENKVKKYVHTVAVHLNKTMFCVKRNGPLKRKRNGPLKRKRKIR